MTGTSRGTRALALALLVGLAPLTLAVVPSVASPGNDHDEPDRETWDGSYTPGSPYAVTQGDTCVAVEALGDGSTSVVEAYNYREGFSAYGFTDIQANQGSQLFLYEGEDGTSLVMLHDKLDGTDGGVATFEFDGLPTGAAAEWVVKDDFYEGPTNYDRFQTDGASATVDWTWRSERTDGAAVIGMEDGDYDVVTLTPKFNEEAYFWNSDEQDGTTDELTSWTLRSGDGSTHDLDMDAPLQIRRGSCAPDAPSASLGASPSTAEPGESVTLDASGSTDADGIAAYHWDFDGDGEIDDTTTSPTASFQYAEEGTYTASVTVEDRAGETASATTTVSVEGEPAPVTAVLSVGASEPRTDEEVTFEAGDSVGPITEYRWSFGDDSGTTSTTATVTHSYDEPGTYTATLVAVGEDGQTAETTRTVTVVAAPEPATPPGGGSGPARMGFVTDSDDDSTTVRFYNPSPDDGFTATLGLQQGALELHALELQPDQPVDSVDLTAHAMDENPTNRSVPTSDTTAFLRLTGTDGPYDEATVTFSLPHDDLPATDDVTDAYVQLQAYDVGTYGHDIRLNEQSLSGFDIPPSQGWQSWMDTITGTALQEGENTLQFVREADSNDSFVVGNVVVNWREPAGSSI